MSKKQELLARVRYIKGRPKEERAGRWDDQEQFVIEVYDAEYEEWSLDSGFPCVHASEYPEQSDANFLHFSIVKQMVRLIGWGYRFLPAVAVTPDK